MAKSHETRHFSCTQVVDGPIVTFTLAHFPPLPLVFWVVLRQRGRRGKPKKKGGREKKKKNEKVPDATAPAEPHWRIGQVAKLHRGRNLATKSLFPRRELGILNIRQNQEFIGAQPDGAKGRFSPNKSSPKRTCSDRTQPTDSRRLLGAKF